MKEWIKPELEQLEISETRHSSKPSPSIDAVWYDGNGWEVGFTS